MVSAQMYRSKIRTTRTKIFQQEINDWNRNAPFYLSESHSPFQKILLEKKMQTYALGGNDVRILDLGAGAGSLSAYLERMNKKVITLDFAPRMIETAAGEYPELTCTLASAHVLPFADGVFDVVIADGILHHLKAQGIFEASMVEIHRVLKQNGIFCFFDRNGSVCSTVLLMLLIASKRLIDIFRPAYASSSTNHEVPFGDHELEVIKRYGFSVLERKFVSSIPFYILAVLANAIEYFAGCRMGKKLRSLLAPVGRIFEDTVSYKWCTVEQCIKLRKI